MWVGSKLNAPLCRCDALGRGSERIPGNSRSTLYHFLEEFDAIREIQRRLRSTLSTLGRDHGQAEYPRPGAQATSPVWRIICPPLRDLDYSVFPTPVSRVAEICFIVLTWLLRSSRALFMHTLRWPLHPHFDAPERYGLARTCSAVLATGVSQFEY